MRKIEHIGIAVQDLEQANSVFKKLFGKAHYKTETVESEAVSTSFFQMGETKIELLEATGEQSAIAKYLDKNRPGIHHIAFDVENIYEEISRLKSEGFVFISDEPKQGADNKLVAFIHPKSANGLLVELCQERSE